MNKYENIRFGQRNHQMRVDRPRARPQVIRRWHDIKVGRLDKRGHRKPKALGRTGATYLFFSHSLHTRTWRCGERSWSYWFLSSLNSAECADHWGQCMNIKSACRSCASTQFKKILQKTKWRGKKSSFSTVSEKRLHGNKRQKQRKTERRRQRERDIKSHVVAD